MGNIRNLLLLTILVCSASAIGRCACRCSSVSWGTARTNSSFLCPSLCTQQCPYSGIYGILDGTWKYIPSDNVDCGNNCCYNTVTLEDAGTVYQGNATTLDHVYCLYNTIVSVRYWPGGSQPIQRFALSSVSATAFGFNHISYDQSSGKATVNWGSAAFPGATQRLECIAGPCLQNVNVYSSGGTPSTSTSASTKTIASYALVWTILLFIVPKR